jgi:hypothetical protein
LSDARYLLAFDSGVEPICEACMWMLSRLQVNATSIIRDRLSDVVPLVGESEPDLLIFHSNLIWHSWEAIPAVVAASPNTRHLMLTGSPEDMGEIVCKSFDAAGASFSTLQTPFSFEQFAEAIGGILRR